MFLKSLEMQGFKSFPDKTVLEFGQGITSVVGPNGSGKSNIADAVRWVLGEQSSKNLRGSKMEDVIFSGTGIRKAKGFAEVTLRLDNSDRALNSDRDEVSVTRRYYRSGESEYILNGEICRLKDVNEMFMDTGLGRDGYSMVSQGRVADMVSSKSGQRREMLEEAAGISHYRYRRNDANRKLAAAEENMIRLRDILTELADRVGPLKIQSEKAQKFIVLAEERKTLEIGLWLHTIDRITEQLRAQEDKLNLVSSDYGEAEARLAEVTESIEQSLAAARELTERIEAVKEEAVGYDEQASRLDAAIAVDVNSIEHNNATIERITKDMEAAVESRQTLDDELTETMKTVEMLKNVEKQKLQKLEEAAVGIESIQEKDREYIEKIASLGEQTAELSLKLADSRVRISTAGSSSEEIRSRLDTIDDIFASREAAIGELNTEISRTSDDIKRLEEEVASTQNAVRGYEMKTTARAEKVEELRGKADETALEIERRASRSKMLDDLEKNMEGYSGSVKSVMREVKRGTLRGINGVLSQLISVDEEYSVAIETALGAAMQNIVTQTENDAKRAINFLKDSKGGRATFLPLTAIKSRELEEKGLDSCYGYIAVAEELVRCDGEYRQIISNLLGRTIVAEDMDSAVTISKKYGQRLKIVTLDGQVINPGGSMTGGSQTRNAGILSRANEIEKLNAECAKLRKELEEIKAEHLKANEDLSECRAALSGTRADLTRLQEEKIRREGDLEMLSGRLGDAQRSLEELKEEKTSAGERLTALAAAAEEERRLSSELEKQAAALRSESEELSMARTMLEEDANEARRNESKVRLELVAVRKDIESKLEIVAVLRHRMSGHGSRMDDLNKEISGIAQLSHDIKERINENTKQAAALRQQAESCRESTQELALQRQEHEKLSDSLRQSEREVQETRERLAGELARLEERKAVLEKEHDDTVSKLYDEYQLTRREARELNIELGDPADAGRRLSEIRNKIRALGNVNVSAIEEYKEVSERYEFMSAQITDVEKSKDELEKLIKELTSKMSEQFREQFVKINRYFGETFAELFDGGKAELILEDEHDALECPIEIKVQPPGKNVQNIDLLSGGEKGLSAIALLFAILKVSPAPFCFFDEVEAALDEVNVVRYAKYARRMTGNTQFILITHRRGTMEEADILYGVTMQEKGVSKLLELKTAEMARKLGIA